MAVAVPCPARRAHCLGALFGQCVFDGRPTLDQDGSLTEWANPWAVQVQSDLETFIQTDAPYELRQGFTSLIDLFRPGTSNSVFFSNLN